LRATVREHHRPTLPPAKVQSVQPDQPDATANTTAAKQEAAEVGNLRGVYVVLDREKGCQPGGELASTLAGSLCVQGAALRASLLVACLDLSTPRPAADVIGCGQLAVVN
jgi:hypothetical protein